MNGWKKILKRIATMSLAALLVLGSVDFGVLNAKAEGNTESNSNTGTIKEVVISPRGVEVKKGETRQFTARLSSSGVVDDTTVTWEVEGQKSTGTTITPDGLLTVGADETMGSITVIATANGDSSKVGKRVVTIPQATSLTLSPTDWFPKAVGEKLELTADIPQDYKVKWTNKASECIDLVVNPDNATATVTVKKPCWGVIEISGSVDGVVKETTVCQIKAGNRIVIVAANDAQEPKVEYTFANTYKLPKFDDCGFTAPEGKQFETWEVDDQKCSEGESIQIFTNDDSPTTVVVKAVWTDAAPTTITEVTGLPEAIGVKQGGTYKFNAEVKGTDTFDSTVTWQIDDAQSEKTQIDQNGNLTIGDDETAASVTVKAIAKGDNRKFDTTTVTIIKKDVDIKTDVKVEVEAGTPETKVTGLDEKIALALLDATELSRVGAGEKLSVYLKAEKLQESAAPAEDKIQTDEMAATISNLNKGLYLDLSMWKQIGTNPEQKLQNTQTAQKLKITVDLPDELQAPSGKVRTYYVIRVHNGQATVLPTVLNGNEISFETDMFSTYSVWYTENAASAPSGNGGDTSGGSGNNDNSGNKNDQNTPSEQNTADSNNNAAYVPKTGDESNMVLWSMLLLVSVVALAEVTAKRKRG